jgi:hypothetical protein
MIDRTFVSDQDARTQAMKDIARPAGQLTVPSLLRAAAEDIIDALKTVPRTFSDIESIARSFRNRALSNMPFSEKNVATDLGRLLSMIQGIQITQSDGAHFTVGTGSDCLIRITVTKEPR